jgi:hypothetical protein
MEDMASSISTNWFCISVSSLVILVCRVVMLVERAVDCVGQICSLVARTPLLLSVLVR